MATDSSSVLFEFELTTFLDRLYLEISDRHRKMDLEDSRRLIIADHLKESIDSLEGKALAYLRVRVVVE